MVNKLRVMRNRRSSDVGAVQFEGTRDGEFCLEWNAMQTPQD
jgi:hypothetical protein